MLEQIIRLVTSKTDVDGITLRFGPLGNKSHQKKILKNIEDLKMEYDEAYPTLQELNNRGWKLESFGFVYDTNESKMQVAIFSREV